jgi:hypothetical protein
MFYLDLKKTFIISKIFGTTSVTFINYKNYFVTSKLLLLITQLNSFATRDFLISQNKFSIELFFKNSLILATIILLLVLCFF